MDAPIKVFEPSIRIKKPEIEIDLFATNINTQFGEYVAFRPDPAAIYIDAFSVDWPDLKFYTLPPISVITRVLSEVKKDTAKGIIVVPFCPTQV